MTLAPHTYKGRRIDHLIGASGYLYRNGYKNIGEFMGTYGFDPRTEIEFFEITKTGIVYANKKFSNLMDCRASIVQNNWISII